MSREYVFLAMVFFHIIDDYFIQSAWLANGKQRSWWEKNAPDPMYRKDYLAALFAHAFSWSFMVHIPVAIYLNFDISRAFIISILVNWIIHDLVDDIKANWKKINLIQDQLLHIAQLMITWAVLIC